MGFFDFINGLVADGTTAFRGVVVLAAVIVFFVVAVKVKFAVATTLITGLMCGVAIFMATIGGPWVMTLIEGETVNALGTTVSQLAV
ncbi:hypothetical protein [Microbacterium oleivorans]|uniref:hypothetical protein n=1 Tax=Microbacterium oleivorans TaxID=273677 RepID=UPI00080EB5E6|nr:hypothetical protein [Microbacterium oleivorans]